MKKTTLVGRPREFNEDNVLKIIMKLFWERGYEGTSLSHIIAATGLKKGSLYATFGDKHAMYLAAIVNYETEVVDSTRLFLSHGKGDAFQRIKVFLYAPIEAIGKLNNRKGCFLCNASSDRAALNPETSDMVQRGFKKLEQGLVIALNEVYPEIDMHRLENKARWLLAAYSGFRVMVRSGLSVKELKDAHNDLIKTLKSCS